VTNPIPETRDSLLVRLGDPADEAAWREFLEIYRPLIYRLACRKGLQDADAEDVTQQALLAVAGAIGRWRKGEFDGSFRAWLSCITCNLMTNFVARSRWRGVGGTSFAKMLLEQPVDDESSRLLVQQEYQAELFRWAAGRVRGEFQTATWDAFWRTTVEGEPIASVAEVLSLSVGSVYAARSRIMARIKQKVRQIEAETNVESGPI
jgi:RNA polymerase sigma factor (sigma-70 family)